TGGQTVNKANANVSVTSSGNPSFFGQTVTITATVNPASPSIAAPGGTVTFFVDGAQQSPDVSIIGGKATLNLSNLSVAGSPHCRWAPPTRSWLPTTAVATPTTAAVPGAWHSRC